jgi:multicomponent Na+:H+ antiporter subunit B
MKKLLGIALAIAVLIVLLHGVEDLPPWADPDQPSSVHVSPRYIERGIEETGVPNIVTAVLADYRGYDTLFETAVIFTAGIAVLMILRRYMP